MNLGQIVYEVSRVNRRTNTQIELLSKVNGELISPQEILDVIAKVKSSILDL